MEVVIQPEPDPDERDALTVSLARLLHGDAMPSVYRSRWREIGVAENVEADYATARPRSRPGATRA
jgi:hypothetical protein